MDGRTDVHIYLMDAILLLYHTQRTFRYRKDATSASTRPEPYHAQRQVDTVYTRGSLPVVFKMVALKCGVTVVHSSDESAAQRG